LFMPVSSLLHLSEQTLERAQGAPGRTPRFRRVPIVRMLRSGASRFGNKEGAWTSPRPSLAPPECSAKNAILPSRIPSPSDLRSGRLAQVRHGHFDAAALVRHAGELQSHLAVCQGAGKGQVVDVAEVPNAEHLVGDL